MSLFRQCAFYAAILANAVLYGIELILYCWITHSLLSRRDKWRRAGTFYVVFNTALLCFSTIFVVTEAVFGLETWVLHRDFPGGPEEYSEAFVSVWYTTFSTASCAAVNLLNEGLMIYRCHCLWQDARVIVVPLLLYAASFGLSIAQLVASGGPHENFFAGLAKSIGTAYLASVIVLGVLVTALIVARLTHTMRLSRPGARRAGLALDASSRIVVESELPCAALGVAYLATFAARSDLCVFFGAVYAISKVIAPQVILLRIVSGATFASAADTAILTTVPVLTMPSISDEVHSYGGGACVRDADAAEDASDKV
ncbi:uncharacterized protein BXZ73DRAFT_54980 [Epithele typhae]|uniref:uncharacterized protein n=1 Tax=Epithele typhae TaxID=378194 RepID=UPI002008382C|nr:uncharacterized protein BXZ73DRAFT_54980 [Epithele typhae]KAH9914393.1 hypothetical protein BXZ73DRAFT_54980 [Epithele typhae]